MVFINYTTMQVTAKIVFYGPGLCGKTTNLQFVHLKTAHKSRGEMISLETETDRTLFFDLLPLEVGVIGGMRVRLQLYTVPGQVFYNATRKLVLKGVDGIVFVADSQVSMLDSNIESLRNLEENLAELGIALREVPIIFQFNKRDLRNVVPIDRLNDTLNPGGAPYFEAAALHGIGVFETLKAISKLALNSVRRKMMADAPTRAAAPPPANGVLTPALAASPPPHTPAPVASHPAPAAVSQADIGSNPLAGLVADTPAPDVEFAEEDTGEHAVRAVATKSQVDIHEELEKLRALTGSGAKPAAGRARGGVTDAERRLQEMLVSDREAKQELKRKASIEVPAELLTGAGSLRIHLAFDRDGADEMVRDVVSLRLGNPRLTRLTLHLDLEVKAKTKG